MDKHDTLTIAIAQMCSAQTQAENLATVTTLAEQAKGQGAEMLALPEVSSMMNALPGTLIRRVSLPSPSLFHGNGFPATGSVMALPAGKIRNAARRDAMAHLTTT